MLQQLLPGFTAAPDTDEAIVAPMTAHQIRAAGYYKKHRLRDRDRHLRKKFGISLMQYQVLLAAQDGRCALCGTGDSGAGGRRRNNGDARKIGSGFAVDHDHTTGRVRALLCRSCNTVLGLFEDNPHLFSKAAAYLRRY